MRFQPPEIYPMAETPFDGDEFDREGFASTLSGIVLGAEDPLVLALNAPWGEGKTTFIKMWQKSLEGQADTVYFDAFESDLLDDPFVSFSSEIIELAKKRNAAKGTIKNLKEKASYIGWKILSLAAPTVAKVITLNAVDGQTIEALKEVKGAIADDIGQAASSYIKQRIEEHEKSRQSVKDFKELLVGLSKDTPLVIFIDELDRCKPTHAVHVLEVIKHFFSAGRIIFVLATHKDQLEKSIKHVYGSELDAGAYLQKFITFEVNLPKQRRLVNSNAYAKYCNVLMNHHNIPDPHNIVRSSIYEAFVPIAQDFDLSLRDMERVFVYLTLFLNSMSSSRVDYALAVFLSTLKVKCPAAYQFLVHKKQSSVTFFNLLEKPLPSVGDQHDVQYMNLLIRFNVLLSTSDELKRNPGWPELRQSRELRVAEGTLNSFLTIFELFEIR
jgi:hypothetical protein